MQHRTAQLAGPDSVLPSMTTAVYGPHAVDTIRLLICCLQYESSEDCLYLNVVRPYGIYQGEGGNTAPVVVWIHGGGLTTGSSGDKRYNASAYVEASVANGAPMVFVSINYRLASFGFLGGQALADEGSLNLGIRDQRLALKWVQDNIAAFGGDPS